MPSRDAPRPAKPAGFARGQAPFFSALATSPTLTDSIGHDHHFA
jgi:hypothetical protein